MTPVTRSLPRPLAESVVLAGTRLARADLPMAVTLVESYFRPLRMRAMEYAWWWLLVRFGSHRADCMTLGACQVRADRYMEYLARCGRAPTLLEVIRTGEHLPSAAEIAADALGNGEAGVPTSQVYTGQTNPHYDALVTAVLYQLKKMNRQEMLYRTWAPENAIESALSEQDEDAAICRDKNARSG